jgi:hypothetical protein
MSRGPENNFIASVHRHLPATVYRMKNHNQYNGGIADCWYSGPKGDIWIEYKYAEVPKRPDTTINLCDTKFLSALQQDWLQGRYSEGRSIAVILGSKDGGLWLPGLSWQAPIRADYFKSWTLTRGTLAAFIVEHVGVLTTK